jgi:hypothetical protein
VTTILSVVEVARHDSCLPVPRPNERRLKSVAIGERRFAPVSSVQPLPLPVLRSLFLVDGLAKTAMPF